MTNEDEDDDDFNLMGNLLVTKLAEVMGERDALAARFADLIKLLEKQPKTLDSWFSAQETSLDQCLTEESRAYEKGWAEGAMMAYGYVLDRLRATSAESLASDDKPCPHCEAVKEAGGFCRPHEAGARAKLVLRIIRAKYEAGFPLSVNFFDDIWPKALAALRVVTVNSEERLGPVSHD